MRHAKNVWKESVEMNELLSRNVMRKMMTRLKKEDDATRKELCVKTEKSTKFMIKKWGEDKKAGLANGMLKDDPAIAEFRDLSVFNGEYKPDEAGEDAKYNVIGDINLSENEKALLSNNPKLAILSKLDEEQMKRELDSAGIKMRWDQV